MFYSSCEDVPSGYPPILRVTAFPFGAILPDTDDAIKQSQSEDLFPEITAEDTLVRSHVRILCINDLRSLKSEQSRVTSAGWMFLNIAEGIIRSYLITSDEDIPVMLAN